MKKVLFILTFMFVLGITFSANAETVKIRPYFALGGTSADVNVQDGSKFAWGLGAQVEFNIVPKIFYLGVELGYVHCYTYERDATGAESKYGALDLLCVAEVNFLKMLVIQVGAGPYFSVEDNDGIHFGLMIGAGVDIPVSSMVSIPIMARFDFIFDNITVIPIRVMSGVTIKI